ncbi:MAG: hypothetical protein JNK87_35700 [Bryobacterales bacterium]|nr:hypothetical protein [Bryobacterales bacterium]
MADLRTDPIVWGRLLRHIRDREGLYTYFYCDSAELVTIGYGELVDSRDGAVEGRRLAGELADNYVFRTLTGVAASRAAVLEDWQRVKDHGQQNPDLRARRYEAIAQLRITAADAEAMLSAKVRRFADRIYRQRPVLLQADSRIAAALVDARYNPAGVVVTGSAGAVGRMWDALTPGAPSYSPQRASQEFVNAWAGRAGTRYQQRHAIRAAWFQEGADAMEPKPALARIEVCYR